MFSNKYMSIADKEARKGIKQSHGGPFGAVIVKDGKIISKGHNQVLKNNDPTCHAEIVAIRKACKKLNTFDLSGCILYTSCYPCPMCMSAIIWSNISTIYYGNTKEDAEDIGFRDSHIYNYFSNLNDSVFNLNVKQQDRNNTIKLFKEYKLDTSAKKY